MLSPIKQNNDNHRMITRRTKKLDTALDFSNLYS